jgi:RNA polymerase sigma factor (sigma-70 family)
VVSQLEGLRALARSLVHADADADDLLQDSAIAAIEHPPVQDGRPVGAWLRSLVRNRWRMDRRSAARRQAHEQAAAALAAPDDRPDPIDHAAQLERLAAALRGLDEPFRSTVTRRYLEGQSAAMIARALGVPAGTVRWRLKTGLDRLRAELSPPPRRKAWLAAAGFLKAPAAVLVIALIVLAVIALWLARAAPTPAVGHAPALATAPAATAARPHPALETHAAAGGVVSGRVVSWETGHGVPGAELTFLSSESDAGSITLRTGDDGGFELAPDAPTTLALTAITAPGFLPYAPELSHAAIHLTLARDRVVRGLRFFLTPLVDYHGTVIDEHGAPVAGARVRVLGTPLGEQALDRADTEWISDAAGEFTFHAVDSAVLEASRGEARGWARVEGWVTNTHRMKILIGRAAPLRATISGRAVDARGAPIADALIRATTTGITVPWQATSFATTDETGAFVLRELDAGNYDLLAEAEGKAPLRVTEIRGGSHDLTLRLDAGLALAGQVVDPAGAPVPAFTILVYRRAGAERTLVAARTLVEPTGRFELRVPAGTYELAASAAGWAPNAPQLVAAGATGVVVALRTGAVLRGRVVDTDGKPIAYARVMRDAAGGGTSVQPSNTGTVTRPDGGFELADLPPGSLTLWVAQDGYHPRLDTSMTVDAGATLGPIEVELSRLVDDEPPRIEQIGIGVHFEPVGDHLRIGQLTPGAPAARAGLEIGDIVTAVDGTPVGPLGLEGVIARLRGPRGAPVTLTLLRDGQLVDLTLVRDKFRT